MKKTLVLLSVCFLFFSCKKNKIIDQPLLEHYPQSWIFTIDESPQKYTYIYTNGNNMFRDDIEKSYSLTQLAEDENCKFFLNLSKTESGDQCITIQLEKEKRRWIFAAPSTNGQEMHMGISQKESEITPPDDDNYKFHVHHLEDVAGVKTISIESVAYPGYFISSQPPGFNYSATQLTLQHESGPEKATAWQCR